MIADNLKRLRELRGLSQSGLAEKASLSLNCIKFLEGGQRPDPQASTLMALARALRVSVDRLLENRR